jgi:hypothetical protein
LLSDNDRPSESPGTDVFDKTEGIDEALIEVKTNKLLFDKGNGKNGKWKIL